MPLDSLNFGDIIRLDSRRICGRSRLPAAEFWIQITRRVSEITVSERVASDFLKNEDYLVQGAIALKMRNSIQPGDRF